MMRVEVHTLDGYTVTVHNMPETSVADLLHAYEETDVRVLVLALDGAPSSKLVHGHRRPAVSHIRTAAIARIDVETVGDADG